MMVSQTDELLFTDTTAAWTAIDSVCEHIFCVSPTSPLLKINYSWRWLADNIINLCWHNSYNEAHTRTQLQYTDYIKQCSMHTLNWLHKWRWN